MTALDPHYTPPWLARELVAALPDARPGSTVADLAAGRGALLDAAYERFGRDSAYVAADADPAAVRWLRRNRPTWLVGRLDMLAPASRSSSSLYSGGIFDALLLNPPFSCRGKRQHSVIFEGQIVKASLALGVALQALERLPKSGTLVALLPSSTFTSEKDENAWRALGRNWDVQELERFDDNLFDGVRAQVSLARVTVRNIERRPETTSLVTAAAVGDSASCQCVEIIRGRVSMHDEVRRATGPLTPLIHTTHLQRGEVTASVHRTARRLATTGPMLLLPRVGLPSVEKFAVLKGSVVLSDCLFALRAADSSQLPMVRNSLEQAMPALRDAYGGSCARYLTVRRLSLLLASLGWNPAFVAADSPAAQCRCPQVAQGLAL